MGVFLNNFRFYLKAMQSLDRLLCSDSWNLNSNPRRQNTVTQYSSDYSDNEEEDVEQPKFQHEIPLKLLLCFTLLTQGLYRYIPGPVLTDLSTQMHEKIAIVPIVFTVRAIGCIVGVIIGSTIHQYLLYSNQKTLFIFLACFLMSATAFGTAMSETFTAIKISFASSGFFLGAVITGVNALYLHMNTLPTKTFCLTLYFFYGIGALFAPLLPRQYFIYKGDTVGPNITQIMLKRKVYMVKSMDYLEVLFKSFPMPFTTVSYSYVTICLLIFVESLLWLARYCVTTSTAEKVPRIDEKEEDLIFKNLTIFTASLTCFISETLVFSYAELLPVIYAFGFETSPRQTTEIMAFYLGCLSVSRILSIFISLKVKPHNIRILGITFVLTGCILWYIYESGGAMYFWLANGFIGFGAGPLFGSAHSWIADKFYVKHLYIMPFFLMSSFSEMVMPWTFFRTASDDYLRVRLIIITISALYVILLVFQHLIVYEVKRRRRKREGSEKKILSLAEILPSSIKKRLTDRHKDISDIAVQEESTTQEQQQPERDPYEIFNCMSELKERLSHNNEGVKEALDELHYSVIDEKRKRDLIVEEN